MGQNAYSCFATEVSVFKRVFGPNCMEKAVRLPKKNKVKRVKADDVKKLMKFFTVPDGGKKCYEDVVRATEHGDEEPIPYDDDETFL